MLRLNPMVVHHARLSAKQLRDQAPLRTAEELDAQAALAASRLAERLAAASTATRLDLSYLAIDVALAPAVAAAVRASQTVDELDLSGNRLGDDGVAVIAAALHAHPTVRTLTLNANQIGPAGAQHLAALLQRNARLTTLGLFSNVLGDAGVRHLARALAADATHRHGAPLPNTTLAELDLRKNKITADGLCTLGDVLTTTTSLAKLLVDGNDVDDNAKTALATAVARNPFSTILRLDVVLPQAVLARNQLNRDAMLARLEQRDALADAPFEVVAAASTAMDCDVREHELCPVCDEPLATGATFVLPCFHRVCAPCVRETTRCFFVMAGTGLTCGWTYDVANVVAAAGVPCEVAGPDADGSAHFCRTCHLPVLASDAALHEHHDVDAVPMCVAAAERAAAARHETVCADLQRVHGQLVAQANAVAHQTVALRAHLAATLDEISLRLGEVAARLTPGVTDLAAALHARRASLEQTVAAAVKADIKAAETLRDAMVVALAHVDVALLAPSKHRTLRETLLEAQRLESLRRTVARLLCAVDGTTLGFFFSAPDADELLTGAVPVERVGATWRGAIGAHGRDYTRMGQPRSLFGSHGSAHGQLDRPVGVAWTPCGDLVVGDQQNRRVQVVSARCADGEAVTVAAAPVLEAVRTIDTGGEVHGVCATAGSDVWAALLDSNCVRLFAGETGQVKMDLRCERPFSVTVLADGAMAVGCYDANKVAVFNADGSPRWTSGGDGFKCALGLAEVDGGELVVCDWGRNRLQVLSTETGRCERIIGQGRLNCPADVAYDAAARVLVVAEYDKVSVWTLEGDLVHSWGAWGAQPGQFQVCRGCCIAPDGTVCVTDCNGHRVQLF